MAGKKYDKALEGWEPLKKYTVAEACSILPRTKISTKWDETVDVSVRLGVNPKYADQMVRGSVVMPSGTGKTKRVLVIAKPDRAKEALEAGADFAGSDEYIKKIAEENWFEFDTLVATPDMMVQVGKIGRVLGPRGLMPNPKVGTVTNDIKKAVSELKAGRVEFRVEKAGIIQTPIGKASFKPEALAANLNALLETLMKLKPATAKGTYMRSVTISTTHGPGVKVDTTPFTAGAAGEKVAPMRRIRVTEEIKPNVFKAKIDETVLDRFVIDRLAYAEARGTTVIWDIAKPSSYDELVFAQGSGSMPAFKG